MSCFEVLRADTADLKQQVYRFRYDIYVRAMGRRQIYANHDAGTIVEPMDQAGRNYLALLGGKIIGTLRGNNFDDPATEYYRKVYRLAAFPALRNDVTQITTKLMLLPEYRNTIYTPRLIQAYADAGYHLGIEVTFLDCNKPLIPFFERMGYFSYCGWTFHKEFGTVRPMFYAVDAVAYLRRLKSFLTEGATRNVRDGQYGGYELIRRHAAVPMTPIVREVSAPYLANGIASVTAPALPLTDEAGVA